MDHEREGYAEPVWRMNWRPIRWFVGVVLVAAGAALADAAYRWLAPAADAPSEAAAFRCCETGDCCCPGRGSCCDPAKRLSPEVVETLKKTESCCETGNCRCPGAGSCCAAKIVRPDD